MLSGPFPPTLTSHSAVPRGTNTTPTNANRAIPLQRNERRVYEDQILSLGGDMTANER